MSRLSDLLAIVARLQGPDGCPWDSAQDLATMRPYLLEEVYELLEAMDAVAAGAADDHARETLKEELGDLLFVVVLLARICESRGWFSLEDAADAIATKMVVRHPHVFPDPGAEAEDHAAPGSIAAWESRKARQASQDGRPRSRLAGVPRTLPALLRAHRQGEKAAAAGFDWRDHRGVLAKIHEELAELEEALARHPPARGDRVDATGIPATHPDVEHELGDLLMAVANLGRHVGAPPEAALRRADDRFQERFEAVERLAWERGLDLPALDDDTLDALWVEAKARTARG
ncbi:MAG: nucleoside triphosphate pyrophosphohydrolase [Deltaproteobacteria bacterium]|nr:MAG: nucleoside triphosphate pyrophosphohydrolase [Deltaproteobacteria bacterium]